MWLQRLVAEMLLLQTLMLMSTIVHQKSQWESAGAGMKTFQCLAADSVADSVELQMGQDLKWN